MKLRRMVPGRGWIVLIGGGEFSFEETESADVAWLGKIGDGDVAFLPTASGSADYGKHFSVYLDEYFGRHVEIVPIYRGRDARRRPNLERVETAAAVYLGGGVVDQLLDTVRETSVVDALLACLEAGGTVVGIAAGAQALGTQARSLTGGRVLPGLSLLTECVVDTNFDPSHDRRLRRLLAPSGVLGLGIPAGSAVLLGPGGDAEIVGTAYLLDDPEAPLERVDGIDPATLRSALPAVADDEN